jgi:hypothetical protein
MTNNASLGELPNTNSEELAVLATIADSVTGLTDLGYKHARSRELTSDLAIRASSMMAGFPDNVSDEDKSRVFDGYRLRKSELVGTRYYRWEGKDTFIPITAEQYKLGKAAATEEGPDFFVLDVDYAFSYSQQQFGALKKETPNKHALIGALRTEVSKYCSNTWGALVGAYKALNRVPRQRGANVSFMDHLDDLFEELEKRRRVAVKREGEGNVPSEAKMKKAVQAFFKALD